MWLVLWVLHAWKKGDCSPQRHVKWHTHTHICIEFCVEDNSSWGDFSPCLYIYIYVFINRMIYRYVYKYMCFCLRWWFLTMHYHMFSPFQMKPFIIYSQALFLIRGLIIVAWPSSTFGIETINSDVEIDPRVILEEEEPSANLARAMGAWAYFLL